MIAFTILWLFQNMNSKVMQVFYGADALPYKDKERTVHFPIVGNSFQGAQNTSEIKFYYDRIANSNTTLVAVARLPNGKIGSKVLESYYNDEIGENYALLELNGFYTQYKGELYISLQGYQGGVNVVYNDDEDLYEIHGTPTIQATGSVRLNIQYATQFVGSGEEENADLQSLAAALGSKLNITSGIYVIDNISKVAETPDNYENGQLFYCLTNNQYYEKTNTSPYYKLAENVGVLASKNILCRWQSNNQTISSMYVLFGNKLFVLRHNNYDYLYQVFWVSGFDYNVVAINLLDRKVYYKANANAGDYIQSIISDSNKIEYVPYEGADENVELGSNTLFAQALGIKTGDGYLGGLEKGDGDYDLVLRCDNGILKLVGDGGVYYGGYEIANKDYVDIEVAKKVNKTSTGKKVYGTDSSGNQTTFDVDYTTGADGNIVRRASGTSQIMVPLTPTANGHATSKKYVDDSVASAISSVYRYKGSKTVAELNALTGQEIGDVYNVSDSGTLTDGNVNVVAGDNVAWAGSTWDKLTSDIDLSVYYTKSETNTLLSAKANTANAVMDDDVSVSGGYVISIKRENTTYPIAQNVTTYFTPKVVATTSDLPAENDGFLYLVVADGYLYYWDVDTSAWVQGNEYATDLAQYVLKNQTIAGIDLSGNISAQDLTDALVYATTSDIENIMED